MSLYNPTAATGLTTNEGKNAVGYGVGLDVADSSDPTTSGLTATVVINASERELFLYDMLGWSEVTGGILRRVLPEPAGFDRRYYCVKLDPLWKTPKYTANVLELDGDGWPVFDIAAYKATYVIPLYEVKEDAEITYEHERFCIWRKKPVAEDEQIPGASLKVESATASERLPLNEVGVRTGRRFELTCKWLDVPDVGYDVVSQYMNKINNAAVTWNGETYDAETVLVTGVEREPRVNGNGTKSSDFTFTFSIRADGRSWNKYWVSGATSSRYVYVSADGTVGGDRVFETADLNSLWMFS